MITYNALVNLEALYGICEIFFETREEITFPKAHNEEFINLASSNLYPLNSCQKFLNI